MHLTNNAVQKNSENYGKFESGNQLSFSQLEVKFIFKTAYAYLISFRMSSKKRKTLVWTSKT